MFTFFTRPARRRSAIAQSLRARPRLECLEDRCLPSGGVLDPTFGTAGAVMIRLTSGSDYGRDVAFQSDGKIVAVPYEFLVARYLPSSPEIGSFTANPNPVASGSTTTLTASNIADGNPGATVTQVAFYEQTGSGNTLLGYGTQSSPGVWTLNYTVSLSSGTYTLLAQAEDSDGVFGDPVAPTLQVL